MNQDTKITLGLIAFTALGYYLWKKSQVSTLVASTQNAGIVPNPTPGIVPNPTPPAISRSAPSSNFTSNSSNFATYANMASDVKSGGFFQSEKVKLNY